MKQFLTALLFFLSIPVFRAQDTITTFLTISGEPTESNIYYFKKITAEGIKTYALYDLPEDAKSLYLPKYLTQKSGQFIFINKQGNKFVDITFVNNQAHGIALHYYPDGKIADSVSFSAGKLQGISTYYFPNGRISSIEVYESDSLLSFQLFNQDGTPDVVTSKPTIEAEFPGGVDNMKTYLAQSIIYPSDARDLGLEGRCFLNFVIDTAGVVSKITIVRGVPDCPECDREAVRVVRSMPAWAPAKSHNRVETSYFNLPITFSLVSRREMRKERTKR